MTDQLGYAKESIQNWAELYSILESLESEASRFEKNLCRLSDINDRLKPNEGPVEKNLKAEERIYPGGVVGGVMRIRDAYGKLNTVFETNLNKIDSII